MKLTELNPVVILALSKASGEAAKKVRPEVEPGEYDLDEILRLAVNGVVKVGEDYSQRFVNKAKPWEIVTILLGMLNTERAAAGKAGIDMAKLVAMAEEADPFLVKEAKKAAGEAAAELKAATMKVAKGKVTTKAAVFPLA